DRGIAVTIFGGASDAPVRGCKRVPVETAGYVSRDLLRRVPLLNRQYGLTKLLERLSYAPGAVRPLVAGGYDIIHIPKPFDFPLAAWVKQRTGARVIYSSHGRDFFPGDRLFLAAIDAMTACSAFNAREVADRYGRTPLVIFNGIDTEHF